MQIIGTRIPRKFFIAKGIGESQHTHHAGSYHLALSDAGIETQNIMTYSSILPKEAIEIEYPNNLTFGAVMECIMSVCDGQRDEILSAGIAYAWLYNEDNEKIGGIVVERSGGYDEDTLIEVLNNSIWELKNKSFSKLKMDGPEYVTQTFVPSEQFGTALVALCFTDYIYPEITE